MTFMTQGYFALDSDVDSHLKQSDYINQTHHDNIADAEHTHVHKHSEEGEEHEHHHEHIGSSQSNLKLNSKTIINLSNQFSIPSIQIFSYTLMTSSEFLFSIFRPPIV
jgi:hypothetical protein